MFSFIDDFIFHRSPIFLLPLHLARTQDRKHTLKFTAMRCLFILSSHQVKDDDFRKEERLKNFDEFVLLPPRDLSIRAQAG